MTTADQAIRVNTASRAARVSSFRMPLQCVAGFFFAFRICITYVGFQSNPSLGSAFTLTVIGCLFAASVFYAFGDKNFSLARLLRNRTLNWLGVYIVVTGASLFWTEAESPLVATGYWCGMAMEVAIVVLLVKGPEAQRQVDAMLKGFVAGVSLVAVIAWLSPTLPDLRIGHDEFLVPNIVGFYSALGFFLAQHLSFENRAWRWCCIGLGTTLLRTISKTSIIAFLLAETFYLLSEKQISRSMKIKTGAAAAVVIGAFWSLLETYLTSYTTESNQAETLTGRTGIWITTFSMGLDHPWIGHGLYSFRSLIPSFANFQPWHAHNELLQQFFEYGVLGAGLIVGLYLSLLLTARRSPARAFGKLAFVLVVFAMIHGLADTANFGPSLPPWLFTALALALMAFPSQTPEAVQS